MILVLILISINLAGHSIIVQILLMAIRLVLPDILVMPIVPVNNPVIKVFIKTVLLVVILFQLVLPSGWETELLAILSVFVSPQLAMSVLGRLLLGPNYLLINIAQALLLSLYLLLHLLLEAKQLLPLLSLIFLVELLLAPPLLALL